MPPAHDSGHSRSRASRSIVTSLEMTKGLLLALEPRLQRCVEWMPSNASAPDKIEPLSHVLIWICIAQGGHTAKGGVVSVRVEEIGVDLGDLVTETEAVFGVYLDRTGGAIMRAQLTADHPSLKVTNCYGAPWPRGTRKEARDGIRELAYFAAKMSGDQPSVAVAISAPGPFVSLNHESRTKDYGTVHPKVGHPALSELNLPEVFRKAFERHDEGRHRLLHIDVYTDAQACAIGEAVSRDLPGSQTLAFILVTEGIGLGIVRGREPIGSALHSEFGMMPVRWDSEDPLRPPKEDKDARLYDKSLSQLAENQSLARRKDRALELRAYYLAQGCLSCAVMVAPHQIVLGADVAGGNLAEETRDHFKKFLKARKLGDQPVFEFEEINGEDYISMSKEIENVRGIPPLHVTGALGLCHAAASSVLRKSVN